jgi:hypothetical protein
VILDWMSLTRRAVGPSGRDCIQKCRQFGGACQQSVPDLLETTRDGAEFPGDEQRVMYERAERASISPRESAQCYKL